MKKPTQAKRILEFYLPAVRIGGRLYVPCGKLYSEKLTYVCVNTAYVILTSYYNKTHRGMRYWHLNPLHATVTTLKSKEAKFKWHQWLEDRLQADVTLRDIIIKIGA